MFVAGPPVVARVGQTVTKEELGGSRHPRAQRRGRRRGRERSGSVRARAALPLLPAVVGARAAAAQSTPTDDTPTAREWLIDAVPRDRRKVYEMRRILDAVVDTDSLFEMGRNSAARSSPGLRGSTAGRSPCWRAIRTSMAAAGPRMPRRKPRASSISPNTFHLPVVHLVDMPGFVIGQEAEQAGTIRHGARALAAIYQAKVPWCSVIMRKVFGVAGAGHSSITAAALPLRVAVGRLGLAADRGRDRSRVSRRARSRAGSREAAPRDRGTAQPRSLAVPHRRGVPGRGDHRPARHAPAAVRVRESGRAAARAGPGRDADAALKEIWTCRVVSARRNILLVLFVFVTNILLRRAAFLPPARCYMLERALFALRALL